MGLLDMWTNNPSSILEKKLRQIIAWAGDGKVRSAITYDELRQFFSDIPVDLLSSYVDECLGTEKIEDGGFVLQDLVNEIGFRLGYRVTHGRFSGKKGENGFDGLWCAPDGSSIVMESKTTDAYRLNLDNISNYRTQLINDRMVNEGTCSVLIVAGRYDTGDLTAQIRGSKHAWNMRVISTDSLLHLLKVKESSDNDIISYQIIELLKPQEFTKLDKLVNLIFPADFKTASVPLYDNVAVPNGQNNTLSKLPPLPDTTLKVGTFIKTAMRNLSDSGFEFTKEELSIACTKEWSKSTLNLNYPFFRICVPRMDSGIKDDKGYDRYWATPFTFGSTKVYITKELYDKDRNKERFIEWYNSLRK